MSYVYRLYAKLCRMRQSWGFGVHSPNIYQLLTDVFRERHPYYAYDAIEHLPHTSEWPGCTIKVNKLLFRMVNYFQPEWVVEVGTGDGQSLKCMAMAKKNLRCVVVEDNPPFFASEEFVQLAADYEMWHFLHIAHTAHYAQVFEAALSRTGSRSVFIVEGIHSSREKTRWWKKVETDNRTGITIDLYDLGLVFFDKKCPKRNFRMTF